jgi:RNA polymerase sigma-70 factor, ECF subfamily
MDDETLVRAAQRTQGKPNEAFAELYRRNLNRIYRYILIRVGDVSDAEDITAQTFLSALNSLKGYRGSGFTAWLFGIARKKTADHFRKSRKEIAFEFLQDRSEEALHLDELIGGALTIERVRIALQKLPADRTEALTLHIFSGLSYAEVGKVMGRSEAAAKMLAYRAVMDLRHELGDLVEEE